MKYESYCDQDNFKLNKSSLWIIFLFLLNFYHPAELGLLERGNRFFLPWLHLCLSSFFRSAVRLRSLLSFTSFCRKTRFPPQLRKSRSKIRLWKWLFPVLLGCVRLRSITPNICSCTNLCHMASLFPRRPEYERHWPIRYTHRTLPWCRKSQTHHHWFRWISQSPHHRSRAREFYGQDMFDF